MKEKRDERKNINFLRNLSHQLKSPINTSESFLKAIIDGFTGDVDSKTYHFVNKAIKKISEARDYITDILDYEMYSEKQKEDKENIDVLSLLDSVAKNLIGSAASKKISLLNQIPGKHRVLIKGNALGLEIAFKNLIENAIKYSSPPGTVSIKYFCDQKKMLCHIIITDNGSGIPEEEIDKIFEPFFRSKKHRLRVSGSGLGLSIVKNIIENHDGTINVESRLNEGSKFTNISTLPMHSVFLNTLAR